MRLPISRREPAEPSYGITTAESSHLSDISRRQRQYIWTMLLRLVLLLVVVLVPGLTLLERTVLGLVATVIPYFAVVRANGGPPPSDAPTNMMIGSPRQGELPGPDRSLGGTHWIDPDGEPVDEDEDDDQFDGDGGPFDREDEHIRGEDRSSDSDDEQFGGKNASPGGDRERFGGEDGSFDTGGEQSGWGDERFRGGDGSFGGAGWSADGEGTAWVRAEWTDAESGGRVEAEAEQPEPADS